MKLILFGYALLFLWNFALGPGALKDAVCGVLTFLTMVLPFSFTLALVWHYWACSYNEEQERRHNSGSTSNKH